MGNGALAIGPKLPRPSSTLPSSLFLACNEFVWNRGPTAVLVPPSKYRLSCSDGRQKKSLRPRNQRLKNRWPVGEKTGGSVGLPRAEVRRQEGSKSRGESDGE